MALQEGNRFFRPTVAQYTSQFVEEPDVYNEMLALGERDQQKRDMTQGALGQMTEYMDVNASPAHEKYRNELLQGYHGEIGTLAEQLQSGANPDQILGRLTTLQRKWQTDPRRRELEYSAGQHETYNEQLAAQKADATYLPQFDETRGQLEANIDTDDRAGVFTPIRAKGLESRLSPLDAIDKSFGKVIASSDSVDDFNYDPSGIILSKKVSYEGFTAQELMDVSANVANTLINTPEGQLLARIFVANNPDATNQDVHDHLTQQIANTKTGLLHSKTTREERLSFDPLYAKTAEGPSGLLPVSTTEFIPNVLTQPAVEATADVSKIEFNPDGTFKEPVLREVGERQATMGAQQIQVINPFPGLNKNEKLLLPEGETSRSDAAVARAKRRYGKEVTQKQVAEQYVQDIREAFPSLANDSLYSPQEVLDIYSDGLTSLSQHANRALNVNDSDMRNEFEELIFGEVQAGDLVETGDLKGRGIYMFDDDGVTTSGRLDEVAEALGYNWKNQKQAVRKGQQEEFKQMLNDATITNIGTHPKEEAVFYANVTGRNGATRRIAVGANDSLGGSMRLASSVYKMMMSGESGSIKAGPFTYRVEVELDPDTRQMIPRLSRQHEDEQDAQPYDLSSLMQGGFQNYYSTYMSKLQFR